jgi:hypothetical protein
MSNDWTLQAELNVRRQSSSRDMKILYPLIRCCSMVIRFEPWSCQLCRWHAMAKVRWERPRFVSADLRISNFLAWPRDFSLTFVFNTFYVKACYGL